MKDASVEEQEMVGCTAVLKFVKEDQKPATVVQIQEQGAMHAIEYGGSYMVVFTTTLKKNLIKMLILNWTKVKKNL